MVEYVVIIALIIGAGYWIISPLLKSDRFDREMVSKPDETLRQLEVQKESAYATIQDLEFDLKMGKLSSEDFEELKRQYKKEAVDCLKAIDDLKTNESKLANLAKEDLEIELEKEILALRTRGSKEKAYFCAQCGVKASHQDRFCASCGAKLAKPELSLSNV